MSGVGSLCWGCHMHQLITSTLGGKYNYFLKHKNRWVETQPKSQLMAVEPESATRTISPRASTDDNKGHLCHFCKGLLPFNQSIGTLAFFDLYWAIGFIKNNVLFNFLNRNRWYIHMVKKYILYQKYNATVHTDAFLPGLCVFPSIPFLKK